MGFIRCRKKTHELLKILFHLSIPTIPHWSYFTQIEAYPIKDQPAVWWACSHWALSQHSRVCPWPQPRWPPAAGLEIPVFWYHSWSWWCRSWPLCNLPPTCQGFHRWTINRIWKTLMNVLYRHWYECAVL